MKYTTGGQPAAPQPGTDALLMATLALAADGVRVFPCHRVVDGECTCGDLGCKSPGKHPRTKNGSMEASTDPGQIKLWWTKWGQLGRLNFGQTLAGRAVVDIDVWEGKPGAQTWEALVAEHGPSETLEYADATLTYRTGRGGTQYVYRLPEGEQGGKADGYGNTLGVAVDFKTGPNAYVMVPGSKTVDVYTVTVATTAAELPDWIATLAREKAKKTAMIDGKTVTVTGGSLLAELILMDPDDPRRGNNWLASLAGHYAKLYRDKKDLFLAHCILMNGMSAEPIGAADFEKTTESIWASEQSKKMDASEHTGWLISGGDHILVDMRPKEDAPQPPDSFADFDIRAVGLVAEPGKRGRSYDVVITRQRDGEQFSEVVEADTLVDFRKLAIWLAEVAGVSVAMPARAVGDMSASTRLLRYLENQKPPVSVLVGQIGWQPQQQQFLTPNGVIKPGASGLVPFEGVRPRPKLPGFDRYKPPFLYDFAPGGVNELREVIKEVLSFHDRIALTSLMSWALMTVIKAEIREKGKIAVFPFFAIEAVSGSGKTTGAVKMIGELTGYAQGDIKPTPADLRDKLAAFRSGFLHMDDPDDLKRYGELLRVAATEGTMTKRQDSEHSMSAWMTGGLLITGEGLGISNQKALLDRTLTVDLPSTKGQRDYGFVKELWSRYDGTLTNVAGTLVAEVLRHVDEIPAMVASLRLGTGRRADGYGVVRAGARVLDWLLDPAGDWGKAKAGKGASATLVDAWVISQEKGAPDEAEDFLTLTVLPWAFRQFGSGADIIDPDLRYKGYAPKVWPVKLRNEQMDDARGKEPYPPGPHIYFNASELCEVWALKEGKNDETRLINANSVSRQASALDLMKRSVKLGGAGQARYWVISGELAQAIIDRSED